MEVADSNGLFMNVEAFCSEGNKISLKSPISDPVKVRYAWKDCPQATLRSTTGLPVTPFEVKLEEPASH